MKIAVIGAGAIGCVIGGYLKEKGLEVLVIGHKDQVDAIAANGLTIEGIRGKFNINIDISEKLCEKVDLIILAVKSQDIEDVTRENFNFIKDTPVLTVQNGVRSDKILYSLTKNPCIVSSIVMFGATYLKPGEVIHNFEGNITIGKVYRTKDQDVSFVKDILSRAFNVIVAEDIVSMKWTKIFVNFNNCIPALTGKSMQETFSDLDLCRLGINLLKEGVVVIDKAGINLADLPTYPVSRLRGLVNMPIDEAAKIISGVLTKLSKEPLYGSILQSIRRNRLSEIDYINGEIVSLAQDHNLTAPLNKKIVDMVHKIQETKRFFSKEEIFNEVNSLIK